MAFLQMLLSKLIPPIATAQPTVPIGEYNLVAPTLTDGQTTVLQINSAGALKVEAVGALGAPNASEATLLAGIGGTEQTFSPLVTWAGASNDTEPPAAGVAVVPLLGYVELRWAPSFVFAGTTPATSVRFRIWKFVDTVAVKIDEFIVSAADLSVGIEAGTIWTKQYAVDSDSIKVTAVMLDGTSPTITGSVTARAIAKGFDSSLTRRDAVSGNPIAQSPAYDALTGSEKVTQTSAIYPPIDEPIVISETSRASGATYYWPSSDGIEMDAYDSLTTLMSITGATTSVATVTMEATLGSSAWTVPIDVTKRTFDDANNVYLIAGSAVSTAGGNLTLLWSLYQCNWTRVRVKVVVTSAATGVVAASFRRAKIGGES
jgi:hypothetical protein